MNKLLAETDPNKLLELKKTIPNLTHSIYEIPEPNRSLILNHIKRFSKKTNQLHILTDIDDTIYPSRFGGADLTFKNHIVYPGVLSFYRHIATTGFVTLLTARPKSLYSDTTETISKAIGRPVDVLYGLIRDLNTGIGIDMIKRLFQPLIPSVRSHPKKIEHITGKEPIKWYSIKYTTVYPEFKFIFIGDSGQCDMICAYHIYRHKKKNPNFAVKASFIHNIIKSKNLKPIRMIEDQTFITELQNRNIYLFNNYIDLAGQLYSLDLIKHNVLDKIIDETITDFKDNKKDSIYDKDPNYISYIETELNESASFFSKQKDI